MKAVQVMATYFGNRRHYPKNIFDVIELLQRQIAHLKTFDLGYPTDLLIVNHDKGSVDALEFLQSIDGETLRNGKVIILNRPWVSNDLSFGSYKYAFHKFKEDYDYWYFNEDDVIIEHPHIMLDMINLLESDTSLGYIATSNFQNGIHKFQYDEEGYIIATGGHIAHAHGGCGLTSTTIFKQVCEKFPEFMQTANILEESQTREYANVYTDDMEEINFSHMFIKAGYKMKCISRGHSFLRLQTGEYI